MIEIMFGAYVLIQFVSCCWMIYRDKKTIKSNIIYEKCSALQIKDMEGRESWNKIIEATLAKFKSLEGRIKELEDCVEYEVSIEGGRDE